MKRTFNLLPICLILLLAANCSITQHTTKMNGTITDVGRPRAYQTTTNIAIHLLFGIFPIKRAADFDATFDKFTKAARAKGSRRIRLIQTETTRWILLLPPFTFILTPVHTSIVGELY